MPEHPASNARSIANAPRSGGDSLSPKLGAVPRGLHIAQILLPGRGGATSQLRKMEGGETDSHPGEPPRYNIACRGTPPVISTPLKSLGNPQKAASSGHLSRQGEGQGLIIRYPLPRRAGCPGSPPTPASCGDARAGIPHNCRRPGRCCVHRGQAAVRSSPDCSPAH